MASHISIPGAIFLTVNGGRTQERGEAQASMQASKAVLDNAKSEAERRRGLADRNVISRDEAERYDVTAEAHGIHKFWGRVIRVGRILGKKNVRTDEPSEHVDTKILGTLVELDSGQALPLGLRVDSYIQIEESAQVK